MLDIPPFDSPADRHALSAGLRHEVEQLALPCGRRVGGTGHQRARQYLLGRLAELRLEPYQGSSYSLPYGHGKFANLVGVVPGRDPAAAPLIVGAHYDSAIDGHSADDNAAAVALALSVAAATSPGTLRRNLVIALYDAEEPPHFLTPTMGSIRFYEDQRRGPFHAAIVMDLIGHAVRFGDQIGTASTALGGLLFATGAESHPGLPDVVRAAVAAIAERRLPLKIVAALSRYVAEIAMSDYHSFRADGVPYLFLTCGVEPDRYHQLADTPDWLDYDKMAAIHGLICELVTRLDGTALDRDMGVRAPAAFAGRESADDDPSLGLEIETLQAAFGPLLGLFGAPPLRTRADVNQLAKRLRMFL